MIQQNDVQVVLQNEVPSSVQVQSIDTSVRDEMIKPSQVRRYNLWRLINNMTLQGLP